MKSSHFIAFLLLLLVVNHAMSQKTATNIVNDALTMAKTPAQIGYSVKFVSPNDVKFAEFFIAPQDIKTKSLNSFSNTTIKYFSGLNATNTSFPSPSGIVPTLSLSQPGLVPSISAVSLGSVRYITSGANATEVTFNIPSNLNVFIPNGTTNGGILFGKTTITTKNLNTGAVISTLEDIIYIRIFPMNLPG